MAFLYVAAVASLLSLSSTVPLQCDDILKPLVVKHLDEIYGRWIFIAGSTNEPKYQDMLRPVQSSWIELLPHSANTSMFNQGFKYESCAWTSESVTFTNDSGVLTYRFHNNTWNGILQETCPGCLLFRLNTSEGYTSIKSLYIFGRSRKFSPAYLDEYKRQLECEGLPPPSYIDQKEKELCPDKKPEEPSDMEHSKPPHKE